MSRPLQDPGWGQAAKGLVFSLVPTLGARRLAKDSALIVMRMMWLSFAGALLMVAVVVGFIAAIGDIGGSIDGRTAALVVALVGVPAQLLAGRVSGPLTGDDRDTAVARYQRAVFLRIALAELPAFVGFAGFIVSANPAVYALGLVIAGAGMLDAAPTARHVAHAQQQLRESGSSVELLPGLLGRTVRG